MFVGLVFFFTKLTFIRNDLPDGYLRCEISVMWLCVIGFEVRPASTAKESKNKLKYFSKLLKMIAEWQKNEQKSNIRNLQ